MLMVLISIRIFSRSRFGFLALFGMLVWMWPYWLVVVLDLSVSACNWFSLSPPLSLFPQFRQVDPARFIECDVMPVTEKSWEKRQDLDSFLLLQMPQLF